jgi:hypothetical protein
MVCFIDFLCKTLEEEHKECSFFEHKISQNSGLDVQTISISVRTCYIYYTRQNISMMS